MSRRGCRKKRVEDSRYGFGEKIKRVWFLVKVCRDSGFVESQPYDELLETCPLHGVGAISVPFVPLYFESFRSWSYCGSDHRCNPVESCCPFLACRDPI